jgi:hypothetical protein
MCPLSNDRIIGEPHQVLDVVPDFQNLRGHAFVERAEIHRAQGNIEEALRYYHMAENTFAILDNDRNRVVTWTWIAEMHRTRQEWKEVVEYCRCALEALVNLEVESREVRQNTEADEYVGWYQRIRQALEGAQRHYAPKAGQASGTKGQSGPPQLPALKESLPTATLHPLVSPTRDNRTVNQLAIHDRRYQIKPLYRNQEVSLASDSLYVILPVFCDSMDEEGIATGDLVILQPLGVGQTPPSGSIVAVVMKGDNKVTLRQYLITEGKRYLRACSTDPRWQSVLLQVNDSMQIRGVAIAVMKPWPERE